MDNRGDNKPFHRFQNNSATSTSNAGGNRGRNSNQNRGRNASGHMGSQYGGRTDQNQNTNNFNGRRNGPHHQGFKYYDSLSEQPLEQILAKIGNNKDFFEFLQKDIGPDFIVLIMKLLSKICDCDFSTLRLHVLQHSLSNSFINTIHLYISTLAFQSKEEKRRNSYFWKDTDSFWKNFAKVCRTVLKLMPRSHSESLSKILKVTSVSIPQIENNFSMHISDEIKKEFKDLIHMAETVIAEFEEKERKLRIQKEEGEPPDDFRHICVYPNTVELTSDRKPFLRKNVIEGPFRDVDHYLDVQFRLLREDFVGPLREGVKAFLSNTKTRVQNVKIHHKVKFIQPVTATEHHCVLLKFDVSGKRNSFRYENSRRFMFGSLVCFTQDNFKTMIFGKIAERKEDKLNMGELIIGFDSEEPILYNVDYLMIECSVYFEPYYHVLTLLQQLTEENFPMKNYIIDVDINATMPSYIRPETTYEIPTRDSLTRWLPHTASNQNFYNFNPSQNEAFIAALTRQFSVIQGPPGTGKTYVGLKIAETLLANSHVWYSNTPMLVICYTNHALDQFLEGLIPLTEKIVRIGGQSKNENLLKYNLRNASRRIGHQSLSYRSRMDVTHCLSEIKAITDTLDMIRKFNCIINLNTFKQVIPNFQNSWLATATEADMYNWLLEADTKVPDETPMVQDFKRLTIDGRKNSREEDTDSSDSDYVEAIDENIIEDDVSELLINVSSVNSRPLLHLDILFEDIQSNHKRLAVLNEELKRNNYEHFFEFTTLHAKTKNLSALHYYAKDKIDFARRNVVNVDNANVMNSQYIPRDDRWNLYFHWLRLYQNFLMERNQIMNAKFRTSYKIYSESKDLENVDILKRMKVIGMTTTGAARLHSSLQMIRSPIVIVEEAAEVLEAHIVSSLTKDCKQLILIGDHQQLKPSTSNYQIERFYYLGISLFERMILNKVECFTLNIQHRMRPEISSLIKPSIYKDLEDHESVLNRPRILGVEKCLYFIDHKHREEADNIGTTKKNKHEVKFLIQLAKYLILNGYKSDEITILAAYLGQMFEFQKERSKNPLLKNIKITVLDNYQGEECHIILLSLVRNNSEKKVGFLSIDNRVCVALSRARNGLYVMGNMSDLCENSELWVKIRETLQNQRALGDSLTLKCENHQKITKVSTAEDFFSVAEGGCDQICGTLLACQHNCQKLCHVEDRDHRRYKCHEACGKPLCNTNPSHLCKKECYKECGQCTYPVTRLLNCNHEAIMHCYLEVEQYDCNVDVPVKLTCGHDTIKPCYIDPEKHNCPFKCDTRIECGHSCVRNCHIRDDPDHLRYKCPKPCEKTRIGCTSEDPELHKCMKLCWEACTKCEVVVRKRRTVCPHLFDVPCFMDVDTIECMKPCKKELPCGHECKSVCSAPCGPCVKKVRKLIPECDHTQTVPCYKAPNRYTCSGKCPRILSCGHVCSKKCKEPCDSKNCEELVDVTISAKCGHTITRLPCNIKVLYESGAPIALETYCTEPCGELLNCAPNSKHLCTGSCSECFQGRIHKRCGEKCGRPLVCNHECAVSCRETCKPCQKLCSYKCKHSACKKRCGEPCMKCNEKCGRKCEHQTCRKRCGDICSVGPCEIRCKRTLPCSHRCVGFCGDPCPPLCGICNKDELEEIFFGTESDDDARFVLLKDCGHILESSGMDLWLTQDENEIKFKVCPKCKTTIWTTERYSDYVKRAVQDITKVKLQQFGTKEAILQKRDEIRRKIIYLKTKLDAGTLCHQLIIDRRRVYTPYSGVSETSFAQHVNILLNRLNETNQKGRVQSASLMELNFIEIKWSFIEEISNILIKNQYTSMSSLGRPISKQIDFLLKNILRETDDITTPEVEDIKKEMNRLNRIVQLERLLNNPYKSKPEAVNKTEEITKIVHSFVKFEDEIDLQTKQLLSELSKILKTIFGLTDIERREIVRAVGLSQGHWYKCPNGHPYAIGECGGAMQVSKCIECGAPIGGHNHALLSTNAVATEMDEARHGAWTNAANMANYDLDDLI